MEEVSVPVLNPHAVPQNRAHGARLIRAVAIVSAMLLLVIALAVACGGSNDDDNPVNDASASPSADGEDGGIDVVMSTFTPTPENNTPASIQTREAQQTAFVETQTAGPNASPTSPPDVTVNPQTPVSTIPANAVKPPDLMMATSGGEQVASIGGFNWYDPELNAGYNGDVPYVALPNSNLEWASSTEASVTVPDSPFAVRSAEVNIFVYNDNVATPQNAQGQVIGGLVYARQTEPVQQMTADGANITLTPDVEPGNYIVEVFITWDAPAELEAAGGEPLSTQYVFVVTVI